MQSFVHLAYVFLAALLTCVAIGNPTSRSPEECQEPTPSELRSLLVEDTHEPFEMARLEHFHVTNDINHFKNVTSSTLPGESRRCRRSHHATNINMASSCPWRYVINNDPNRRPETIIEAECNCRNRPCIDGMDNTRCQPVQYYIPVLRKYGCENGMFLYRRTMERITVGCTCVIRHSHLRV